MSQYRILLVVMHPVGGIRTFLRYVFTSLDAGCYQLTLLAPAGHETDCLLSDLAAFSPTHEKIAGGASALKWAREVARLARHAKPDLVYSHGFGASLVAYPAVFALRLAHLVTCHDVLNDTQLAGLKGVARAVALTLALGAANAVHCPARDVRNNLLQKLPALRLRVSRLVVIPHGIQTQRFVKAPPRDLRAELGLDEDTFIVGFLGRFMAQKGFRYLTDALAMIRDDPRIKRRFLLVCFGEGGYIREEAQRVAALGLSSHVRFLPFVADVAATLKGLDVVTMPSLWEACPLLPMEAMSAGIPIIGTSCIGLREVLEDTPAVKVPPRDAEALAAALRAEMATPTKEIAAGFAPEAARRFEVSMRARELEEVLLTAMNVNSRMQLTSPFRSKGAVAGKRETE